MVVVAALLVGVIWWNAFMASRQGWVPEGDSAIITLRTHDVLSAKPPLLGNPTTAGRSDPGDVYHPGPLEFVLLAPALRLFGPGAQGMLWGTAAINSLALVVLVYFAWRRKGPGFSLCAAAAAMLLVWSLGSEIPHDPYNPHVVLVPLAALLVLVWSVADGDLAALAPAVVFGSLVAQSHAYDAIPVAVLTAWSLVAVVLRAGGRGPRPGAAASRSRRWIVVSAASGFVLWLPPMIDQVVHRPGNLSQLFRFARDGGTPVQGLGFAVARLADYLVPPPRWLDREPSFFELVSRAGMLRTVGLVAMLIGAGVLAVRAWRSDRRAVSLLLITALVAAGGSTLTAARLPEGTATLAPYNHRHWWPTAMFFWLAAGWAIWEEVSALLAERSRLRRGGPPVIAVLAAAFALASSARVTIGADRGSASFGALRALVGPVAGAVRGAGPVLVEARGAQAFTSIEPGLLSALVLRGIDARVAPWEAKVYGGQRVATSTAARVLIISGDDTGALPPGAELLAEYDPAGDVARGLSNAGVSGRIERIRVFITGA